MKGKVKKKKLPQLKHILLIVFVLATVLYVASYVDDKVLLQKHKVDITYLVTDIYCEQCYDVTLHKAALEKLGVIIGEERRIDVWDEEGKEIMDRYSIRRVPTFILSSDASFFKPLMSMWNSVGRMNDDGTYLFHVVDHPLFRNDILSEKYYYYDRLYEAAYSVEPRQFFGNTDNCRTDC